MILAGSVVSLVRPAPSVLDESAPIGEDRAFLRVAVGRESNSSLSGSLTGRT